MNEPLEQLFNSLGTGAMKVRYLGETEESFMSGFADLPPLPAGRAAAIETILRDWLVAYRYMADTPDPAPIRLDSEGVNREEVQYPGFIK